MSQGIFPNINPATTSGNQLSVLLNNFKDAVVSGFSGTSRPSQLQPGGYWIDTTNDPTTWAFKIYNGTLDITVFTLDLANGTAAISSAANIFEIAKVSADAVGPILSFLKKRTAGGGQTLIGDSVGLIQFQGTRDDGIAAVQARMRAVTTNNTTATQQGAYIVFESTTFNGATLTEIMRMVDGKVGVGTVTPDNTLHVKGTGIKNERSSDDAIGATEIQKKSRVSALGQVQNNDVIHSKQVVSTDNAGSDAVVATETVTASQTHTSTAQGVVWSLKTVANNSTTLTDRIVVNSDGSVSIPTIGPISGVEYTANKNQPNGYAGLDGGGLIPSSILPAYVDDVLEFANLAAFPVTGETGKIYIAQDTNKSYRWSGSSYFEVSPSLTDALLSATAFTLGNNRHLETQAATDSTTTGANALLTAFTAGVIRLTNASLTSIAGIPAGADGQLLTVINRTGVDLTIQDSSDALGTAANRIFTGVNVSVTHANNAAFLYQYDITSARWQLIGGTGSGSGGGVLTYITNYNFEKNTTGWVAYQDSALAIPVDGTGGSPTVTITRTTTAPLRGVASGLFTKTAINSQGQGISYDFVIDSADQGKMLQGYFDYQIASGTYADGDMSVWIYDVTNTRMIQPAPYIIRNSEIAEKMPFEFQTASNSVNYRLILHCASTSAVAYTLKVDNFIVYSQAKLYGSAITDWAYTYSPTIINGGTTSLNTAKYRFVGDTIEISGIAKFTSTGSAGNLSFSLPSGRVGDTTKIPGTFNDVVISNAAMWFDSGAAEKPGSAGMMSSTTFTIFTDAGTQTAIQGNQLANGDYVRYFISTPIVGMSSSQIMSADADTRVVDFKGTSGVTQAVTADVTDVTFVSVKDSHSSWNGSQFTVKVPGDYSASVTVANNAAANARAVFWVNGIMSTIAGTGISGEFGGGTVILPDLKAGDIISVRIASSGTLGVGRQLSIKKIAGPSQIMASESVSALYTGAPPTGTLNSSINLTTFGTRVKDSHNAYSGGNYVVPMSGVYSISTAYSLSGTLALNLNSSIYIYVNGVSKYYKLNRAGGAITIEQVLLTVNSIPLLAGDIVSIRASTDASGAAYRAAAEENFFSIVRTGNY